jgi:GntR family transcriptional regulator
MTGIPNRLPRELGKAATRAKAAIFELIETGVFGPGTRLSGERELAEQVAVSRAVLRDALASLERDGKLQSSPWRGWFVVSAQVAERLELKSFSEMARSKGLTPGSQILSSLSRPATFTEAKTLAISAAAPIFEIRRVRTLDGMPICFDISIIPLQRAPELEGAELNNASLYEVLEELAGIRIVRSDYTVHAEAAQEVIARYLKIKPGDPVLVGEEIASDLSGTPLLLGSVTYRGDAYEFQATLYRSNERSAH